MRNNSTMTGKKFLAEVLWKSLIFMMWYQHLLFRCLPGMTYSQSKGLLWIMLVVSILLGTFLVFRHRRTGWTTIVCVAIPLGLYTVWTYLETVTLFITAFILAAVLVSVVTASAILLQRVGRKGRKRRRRIWISRFSRCLYITQSSFAAAFLVIMLFLGVGGIFGTGILRGTRQATVGVDSQEQNISNNIDTVLLLQEEEWGRLSTTQRINVLQCVANIEARYLGLPNELNVVMANLEEGTLGCYIDSTHTVCIALEHIEEDPAYAVLETLCHEAFHSYEHRLVDVYNGLDGDARKLRIYARVARYAEEFGDYTGAESFSAYYNQYCETDSREYAIGAVEDYYERIYEYLEEEQQITDNIKTAAGGESG